MNPDDQLRASDSDRQSVATQLNVAVGEGRLTLDEFSDRIGTAYGAQTQGELEVLVRDLPATTAPTGKAIAPAPPSAISSRFGSVKRGGRWLLGPETAVGASVGSVKLDLRDAELSSREVSLSVRTFIGSIKVWVPSGVRVIVEGSSSVGSRSIQESNLRPEMDVPTLRLRLDSVLGSVKVYRT